MLRYPLVVLPLLLVALGPGGRPIRGDDSAASTLLKDKGLSKAGTTFVIEDETAVIAKMKDAKALFANHAALIDRRGMQEQFTNQLAQMEDQRLLMQNELAQLNQAINQQSANNNYRGSARARQMPNPLVAQRTQLNANIAELTQTQKTMKLQAPSAKDKSAIDDQINKKAEEIRTALEELRPILDDVTRKYASLKEDESIKKAMDDLKKETKANFKLGPSETFMTASKALENAEKKYLGKKHTVATPKKKAAAKK